jgi:hypothetical protein
MNEIMRYVRDRRGNKVGILIGKQSSDFTTEIKIGWSRCKTGDKFDRDEGILVARRNMGQPMPQSFVETAKCFRVQCFLRFNYEVQKIVPINCANEPRPKKPVHNSGHRLGCNYQGRTSGFVIGCTCHQLAVQRKQNLGVKA